MRCCLFSKSKYIPVYQNNGNAWQNNAIYNCQWAPAMVTQYVDTPPCLTCIVESYPYMQHPILTSVWQMTQTSDSADVRPLGGDAAAGFDL
eukprot:11708623-Ditylum_brightwellii.AAC.1